VLDHNRAQVGDATTVTFSVEGFNPLKLYPLSGNVFKKWFASHFLFIHAHLIKIMISNSKSYCCNDTFADAQFTSLLAKNV